MNPEKSKLVSSYLQYLPAILQEDPFMGRFLLAFEKILSGWIHALMFIIRDIHKRRVKIHRD